MCVCTFAAADNLFGEWSLICASVISSFFMLVYFGWLFGHAVLFVYVVRTENVGDIECKTKKN